MRQHMAPSLALWYMPLDRVTSNLSQPIACVRPRQLLPFTADPFFYATGRRRQGSPLLSSDGTETRAGTTFVTVLPYVLAC